MAPHVVVSGTGTYFVAQTRFFSGATPCDDPAVLDAVKEDGLDWVTVEDLPEASVEVTTSEPPPEQVEPSDERQPPSIIPNDALLAQVNHKVVDQHVASKHEGKLEKSDLRKDGFPCEYCDKVLQSSAGKATHERVKHAEEIQS